MERNKIYLIQPLIKYCISRFCKLYNILLTTSFSLESELDDYFSTWSCLEIFSLIHTLYFHLIRHVYTEFCIIVKANRFCHAFLTFFDFYCWNLRIIQRFYYSCMKFILSTISILLFTIHSRPTYP